MQIQTYLALEIGLTRRLQKAWARESKPAYEAIANAVNDEDWHTATALVHKLDMTHVGEENKEWIKHYLLSCAVYGAKRANKKGPQFVGAGNHQARIDQVTQTICTYFEHRGTALVQAKALQLIAKAENAAKAKALASVQKGAPLGNQNAAGPHTTQATISVEHVNDTRITLVAQDKYVCNGVRTDFDINVGKLTLSKSTGTWQVTDMSVSDTHRGQGLNTSMLEKAVHEVGPFNTTGVFSPQGKAQMGSLVRRGLADDVGNGDYLIHFKQPTTKADEQPLYVSRPLTNPDPLIAWAKKVGFETTCLPEDLHVTVVYSKAAMDWTALAPDTDPIEVAANGRGLELFGEACVLTLTSPELQKRFQEFRDSGASFDYDKYTPHVTITYNVPPEFDIEKVKPFMGTLVLGPEVYEAINSDKDFAEKGDVEGHEFHGNQYTGGQGGTETMYRGVGDGSTAAKDILWVTPHKDLAAGYAGARSNGSVEEHQVTLGHVFDAGNDRRELTPKEFTAMVMGKADVASLDKKAAIAARNTFIDGMGSNSGLMRDLWADDKAKAQTASFLKAMGFDSIKLEEDGKDTYGVLHATKGDVAGHEFHGNQWTGVGGTTHAEGLPLGMEVSLDAPGPKTTAHYGMEKHTKEDMDLIRSISEKVIADVTQKNPALKGLAFTLSAYGPTTRATGLCTLYPETEKPPRISIDKLSDDRLIDAAALEEKRVAEGKPRWCVAAEARINLDREASLQHTFTHEFGHAVYEAAYAVKDTSTYFQVTRVVGKIGGLDTATALQGLSPEFADKLAREVSTYALTNDKEFFAESFAMVHAPGYVQGSKPEFEKMVKNVVEFAAMNKYTFAKGKKADSEGVNVCTPEPSAADVNKVADNLLTHCTLLANATKEDMANADLSVAGKLNPLQSIANLRKRKKVIKADANGRYVTPFVSFADEGEGLAQLVSSQNSSRMATWGFMAECEQTGQTRYQISAVLDGRTSEFCKMIDGKTFPVDAANSLINDALAVQDPADLAQVQPWPDQSKDAIAAYEAMSEDELVAEGLSCPPFHPNCRSMCVTLADDNGVNQGEDMPATEGGDNNGPIPDQEATAQDFTDLGIDASDEEVKHWNDYVGLSPIQALLSMFGDDAEAATADMTGKSLKVLSDGSIQFMEEGSLADDGSYSLQSVFDPFTGVTYLTEADFEAATDGDAAEFFSRVLNGMIDTTMSAGGTAITVEVGNAAYNYVQMGFVPQPDEWQHIRLDAMDALQGGKLSDTWAALDADQKDILLNLLSNPDEMALQTLVDLGWDINGKSLGDILLEGVDGAFTLDITDPLQVARAQAYLQ